MCVWSQDAPKQAAGWGLSVRPLVCVFEEGYVHMKSTGRLWKETLEPGRSGSLWDRSWEGHQ